MTVFGVLCRFAMPKTSQNKYPIVLTCICNVIGLDEIRRRDSVEYKVSSIATSVRE